MFAADAMRRDIMTHHAVRTPFEHQYPSRIYRERFNFYPAFWSLNIHPAAHYSTIRAQMGLETTDL